MTTSPWNRQLSWLLESAPALGTVPVEPVEPLQPQSQQTSETVSQNFTNTFTKNFRKFETWISVEHCGTLYLELKWRIHMNSTFRKKHELQVPVFFYGAAREDCRNSMEFQDHGRNSWRIHVEDLRSLAELRRCLGCATVSVHQADSDSDSDSDSGRYFSGAAKGEWCQPENVDRFFIIFNVFNFLNFKHSFSMFFCIFLSDFHQAFLQWSCETVKICEDLWRSVKL